MGKRKLKIFLICVCAILIVAVAGTGIILLVKEEIVLAGAITAIGFGAIGLFIKLAGIFKKETVDKYVERIEEDLKAKDKELLHTQAELELRDKTIAELNELLKNKDNLPNYKQIALEFREKGQQQEAIDSVDTNVIYKEAAERHIFKAELLIEALNFAEAEQQYIEAAEVYPSYDTNLAIAKFYYNLNMFHEAIGYYTRCLNFEISLEEKAIVLNNMGNAQKNNNDYPEAESSYNEALEIRQQLADENPKALAATLNNLANLHRDIQQYPKAEQEYKKALEIRRKLANENPKTYLPDVAVTLNNLASLHRDIKEYPKAEQGHKEALEIRRKLANENPKTYLPNVARALNNLANLHRDIKKYPKAEEEYKEALEIRRKLASENPKAYLPNVATTLNNLAEFYQDNVPNKELSLQYANEAIEALDKCNDTPFVREVRESVEQIIKKWQQ